MENIVIIKYNAGNVQSVLYALQRIGKSAIVTDNPSLIKNADKIIFPGVGEASSAMQYLKEKKLDQLIIQLQQPVLGICLGMQLLCNYSEENNTKCLGIFNHTVTKFTNELKVPEIGWNSINQTGATLFDQIEPSFYGYYVHSYFAPIGENTIATTNYGINFSAALQYKNFWGVQFHPEKSGKDGEQILANFLNF